VNALRSLVSCAVALTALSASGFAHAIPPYPGDLQAALKLSYTPQCAICHEGGVTGLGTVTTPFGVAMRAHGLTDDPSTFPGALAEMENDNVDSVGRGYSDIQALKLDEDPDTIPPNAIPTSPLPPDYGCNMGLWRAREPCALSWVVGIALVLGAARRRRPR
jgi:hypothetical protein